MLFKTRQEKEVRKQSVSYIPSRPNRTPKPYDPYNVTKTPEEAVLPPRIQIEHAGEKEPTPYERKPKMITENILSMESLENNKRGTHSL